MGRRHEEEEPRNADAGSAAALAAQHMFSMLLAASKIGSAANAMNARLPACFQILVNQ